MDDRDYYNARARQEQDRAARARCVEGRRIHDQLAALYRQRAAERPPLQLVVG
jgi:hypothetical protein